LVLISNFYNCFKAVSCKCGWKN